MEASVLVKINVHVHQDIGDDGAIRKSTKTPVKPHVLMVDAVVKKGAVVDQVSQENVVKEGQCHLQCMWNIVCYTPKTMLWGIF